MKHPDMRTDSFREYVAEYARENGGPETPPGIQDLMNVRTDAPGTGPSLRILGDARCGAEATFQLAVVTPHPWTPERWSVHLGYANEATMVCGDAGGTIDHSISLLDRHIAEMWPRVLDKFHDQQRLNEAALARFGA